MSVLISLPFDLFAQFFPHWIDQKSACKLDSSFCSNRFQVQFLEMISQPQIVVNYYISNENLKLLKWVSLRNISISSFSLNGPVEIRYLTNALLAAVKYLTFIGASEEMKPAIDAVVSTCRNIKKMCLCFKDGSVSYVEQLAKNSPNMKSLLVNGPRLFTDVELIYFSNHCLCLKDVCLWGGTYSNDGVGKLVKNCKFLTNLIIGCNVNLGGVTNDSVLTIASHCKNLKTFQFLPYWGSSGADGSAFLKVVQNCKSLVSVGVSFIAFDTNDLKYFIEACSQCTELELNEIGIQCLTDDLLCLLAANCKQLTSLKIDTAHDTNFTNVGVAALVKGCVKLTNLTLSGRSKFDDEAVLEVATSAIGPKLFCFGVSRNTNITDKSMMTLAHHCKRVTYLSLVGCTSVTMVGIVQLASSSQMSVVEGHQNHDDSSVKRFPRFILFLKRSQISQKEEDSLSELCPDTTVLIDEY